MSEMLSGNEAIARGAWESGVRLAAAYPGTPSTEILESLAKYEGVYCEWSPNEKVAMEVGTGASWAGARALVCMKHVGLNVAADPFFSAGYTGVEGGLVIVSADDPGMHSSQDEQDNRNYAKFAKVPVVEPSDSGEAREFIKLAFDLSEDYDTPVLFRTTTRTSHSKSIVESGERLTLEPLKKMKKNWTKYTMMPANAIVRHPIIEQRLATLAEYAETSPLNRMEMGDKRVGFVCAGASYAYTREAFPEASFLKLGMTYPLPKKLIADFRAQVEKLYVVEELDPFIEELIRLQGIKVDGGKGIIPICGELDPGLVARCLVVAGIPGVEESLLAVPSPVVEDLVGRPPTMCPGCSHRGVFSVLKKLRVFVSGDIGCYALGALPPFGAMHCSTCMGASISMAHGMAKVLDPPADPRDKVVAVIGDSTFFHTGINSLMDVAYNKSRILALILDNRTTAMTGGQENPGTGKTLLREPATEVNIPGLCRDMGLKRVVEIDPYDLKQTERVLREELAAEEPSVVIAKAPCVLQFRIRVPAYRIDADVCTGCKRCLQAGCMALNLYVDEHGDRKVEIQADQCAGCGVCSQLCKEEAILPPTPGGVGLRTPKGREAQ
ncbi:MAG: indolepyruvate ferredoxin oxidoreductase subunit alpha [Actinobacteria bacterium]|nr:indolepyruvate ferredoxin oxidoreductase subunit alpha [Actinomycetota bacterium]